MRLAAVLLPLLALPVTARALVAVSAFDTGQLAEIRSQLFTEAAKSPAGLATRVLLQSPDRVVQFTARLRTAEAEIHQGWSDEVIVRDGEVDLVTGGTVLNPHPIAAPGEIRGSDIQGGTVRRLKAGELAEIPAGVPHLMRVPADTRLLTLIYKLRAAS